MDIQEFDESKFSIALSVNYVVYWLVERLSRFGKRNLELSDRFAFQDNSVAVGSAWSPAFCSSTKKKPVPQKSEPRIGCGATCRAALLLVASRQLKLLQPPIPRIPCIITSFASHFFPSPFPLIIADRVSIISSHQFAPRWRKGGDIRSKLQLANCNFSIFIPFAKGEKLSLYVILGNSILLKILTTVIFSMMRNL